MSLQVEKLEKNMAKLTIEVSAEDLDKAMEKAYQKQKSRISLPGFRKGKAPRKMIESMYGKGVFMEDAVKSEEKVVIDGNITTSRGLGTAIDFSLSLISQLLGQEKADQIAESVVYK